MSGDHDENVIPLFAGEAGPAPADSDGDSTTEAAAERAVPEALLLPALEACLFAVPGVLALPALEAALGVPAGRIEVGLELLRERLATTGSGVRLVQVGDGWQLRTDARLASWVARARGGKPQRLGRAALETLAIVAFRQPVSKSTVDDLRGVDSGGILRGLLDRGLVRTMGRSEEPGRPIAWGTTPAFLELFGLRTLADLPTLKDLRPVLDDDPDASVTPVVPFPAGPAPADG